jgi:D-beta-D-heptose 7-phosphate kinase/D-beta-D-heptose 1-phosphate adenosyltransferase
MKDSKLVDAEAISKTLRSIRDMGLTIVFTNGCFDILHPGHVDYLQQAKDMGDLLVVGVNDDDSISRLKGADRPIHTLEDRTIMLAALQCVDYVVPFSDDTPLSLIQSVRPDILVKGDDYSISEIAGSEDVLSYGGKVELVPLLKGYSTTDIIDRIKNL